MHFTPFKSSLNEYFIYSGIFSNSQNPTPKWITTDKTYTIPQHIWDVLFIDHDIPTHLWTYYKNKIGSDFDSKWFCLLILKHRNVGKNVISMQGYCKHTGCRKYDFQFKMQNYVDGVSPEFKVRVSQLEIAHKDVLTRQLRGAERDEYKRKLKSCKPATLSRQLVLDLDMAQFDSGNANVVKSDEVLIKARSEMLLANDLAKDDFDDMLALQKETESGVYIKKVISPFAVYMHSSIQYKVLAEMHRRKKPDEEIVGFMDGTGDVVKVSSETSTHPILYYPLLIAIKPDPTDKTALLFPVTDCINSGHAAPNISSWLNDFNESFIKECPTIKQSFHRILSDFSYANFHGVLHAFQSMRIQQYLYVCYKYAVRLSDFDTLKNLTKLEMCKAHLSKTFVEFVRKYFPSKIVNKKSCYEQKFIVEILCAMMICRSYNVLKEVYRNLCVLLISKYETPAVLLAKEKLIQLCTFDDVLNGDVPAKYRFDELIQTNMDQMSECTTVYEYNESILKLPIYKSSSFYYDFQCIYDKVEVEVTEESNQIKSPNKFFNAHILPQFMTQFSGILPLWTAITIPKGSERLSFTDVAKEDESEVENEVVEIIRKSNQTAESQMNVKQLMKENALELGSGKIKATRFVKLLRPIVLSHGKRYLIKLRRGRLNHGIKKPNAPKDNSKVKKRIVRHIRAKAATVQQLKKLKNVTHLNDETSIQNCKESWGKRILKQRKKFSYFQKKTLLSSKQLKLVSPNQMTTKKPLNVNGKMKLKRLPKSCISSIMDASVASSSQSCASVADSSSQSCASVADSSVQSCDISGNSITQDRGDSGPSSRRETTLRSNELTFKIPTHFIESTSSLQFIVAKINHHKISLNDYKSILPEFHLTVGLMNYIFEYMLPSLYVNLTKYAADIFSGVDTLPFSLVDKMCYMPIFHRDSWHIFVFNTKRRTFTYYNPAGNNDINFCFFYSFIKQYNLSVHHKHKLRGDGWEKVPFHTDNKTSQVTDSGIYVIRAAFQFITEKHLHDFAFNSKEYRQLLINEISQFSDDMANLCSVCAEENDASASEKVDWSMCDGCNWWFHDTCCVFENGFCPLCVEYHQQSRIE